ncbi:MAG: hypothetical protein Q4D92_00145 [Slackia sp.]|nr:hypothetical protein [Slackia sp.]
MAVLFGIVAIVGVLSWAIVKSDEMSGMGRKVVRGSFRHPHGRLVAVHCDSMPEESLYRHRLLKRVPVITSIIALLVAAAGLVMEANGVVTGVVIVDVLMSGVPVVLLAGECILRLPKPSQKFSVYILVAFAGLLLATACSMLASALGGSEPDFLVTVSRTVSSVAGCALGCALAAAAVRELAVFKRRFEDGYESQIALSPHAAVYKAYRELMVGKKAWESGRKED